MKKQILFVLGLLMAFAVQVCADVVYTLPAVKNTSNSSYSGTYDVTINDMLWEAPGNQSLGSYWRIGGNKITNEARSITAKSAMSGAAKSVVISHNGVSKTPVNVISVKITVASDAAFSNIIDEVTVDPLVDNSATGIAGSFTLNASQSVGEWPTGSYYKITFYITNSGSNAGIDFTNAIWQSEAGAWQPTYPVSALTQIPLQPQTAAANVMSIYSDVYTSVAPNADYNYTWFNAPTLSEEAIYASGSTDGDRLLHYTGMISNGYLHWELGSTLNLSGMQYLHLDVYPVSVSSLQINLLSNGDEVCSTTSAVSLTAGEWNSIDLNLSSQFSAGVLSAITQIQFVGQGELYLDNVYFSSVQPITDVEIMPDSVVLNATTLTLRRTESFQFIATVYPENARNKTVTWTATSSSSFNLDEIGLLMTTSSSTSGTITATTANGKTATCQVTMQYTADSMIIRVHPNNVASGTALNLYAKDVRRNEPLGASPGTAMTLDGDGWYRTRMDNVSNMPISFTFRYVNGSSTKSYTASGVTRDKCYYMTEKSSAIEMTEMEHVPSYTIRFENWNGAKLQESRYPDGALPTLNRPNPTKAGDSEHATYTFTGWIPELDTVRGANVTYVAKYGWPCTVTFLDYDGSLLDTQSVPSGTAATAPETPTYDEGIFAGWDQDFSNVLEDMTVTAIRDQYTSIQSIDSVAKTIINPDGIESTTHNTAGSTIIYTSDKYIKQITFVNQSSEPNVTWSSGEAMYYPAPRKEYVWTGCAKQVSFKENGSSVFSTGSPTFLLSYRNCEGEPEILDETNASVDFYDWDGFTWLKTSVVPKGQAAVEPANPTREGYTFAYWDKDFSNVQANMKVKAVYHANQLSDTILHALPALNRYYDFLGVGKKGAVLWGTKKIAGSYSTTTTHPSYFTADITTDFQALDTIANSNGVLITHIDDLNKDGIMDFGGYGSANELNKDKYGYSYIWQSRQDGGYGSIDGDMLNYFDLNRDGRQDYIRMEPTFASNGQVSKISYFVNYQQPDGSFVEEPMLEMTQDEYEGTFNPGAWQEYIEDNSLLKNYDRNNHHTGIIMIGVSMARAPQRRMPASNIDFIAEYKFNYPTLSMDMDGDGWPDLINERSGIVWYQRENNKWIKEEDGLPMWIRDLNNDQIPDMVFVDAKKAIYSVVSQANGSFSGAKLTELTVDQEAYIKDFNNDGYPDILAALSSHNHPSGYAYTVLFLNNGNGTFTEQSAQNFTAQRLMFKACQDIDGDGNFDMLAYELDNSNNTTGKVYQLKGNSNHTFAAPQELYNVVLRRHNSSIITPLSISDLKKYTLNVADLEGDGKQEIWASRNNAKVYEYDEITVIKSMSTATENTAPTAPAMPQLTYESGVLKITWGSGSDIQTPTVDLTYALRIGTTPGGNEILNGHALADGTRRNFEEGNMGHLHEYTFDLRSYAPMTIYVAVQAIDAQYVGSAWSEEAVLNHEVISANFTLNKEEVRINESTAATYTRLPGYIHEWVVEDGAADSTGTTEMTIHFNAPGTKKVTHLIKNNGVVVARSEKNVNVLRNGIGAVKAVNARIENYADYTMDGIYDIVTDNLVKVGLANTASSTGAIDPNAITVRLKASSAPSWTTVYLYAWTSAGSYGPNWPGTPVNQDAEGWWTYSFNASVQNINIIWNNGDREQTVDITDVTASTCYALGSKSGNYSVTTQACPEPEEASAEPEDIGGASYQFTNAVGTWNAAITSGSMSDNKHGWIDHTHNGYIDYIYASNNRYYALIHNGVNDIAEKREHSDFRNYAEASPYSGESITNPSADINHNGYYDFVLTNREGVFLYTRQANGNYTESSLDAVVTVDKLRKSMHVDWNRDGFIDFAYMEQEDIARPHTQLNVLENQGGGKFVERTIPFMQSIMYADFLHMQLKDINADGYADIIAIRADGAPYILWNTNNQSYSAPYILPQGDLSGYRSANKFILEDIDNNGFVDILIPEDNPRELNTVGMHVWYMGAGGVEQQGFLKPSFNDQSMYGNYTWIFRMRDHLDLYESASNMASKLVGVTNEAPSLPANVRTRQTSKGLWIEWDAAADDHTPAEAMRYNLSVKKAGLSGEGAYLISPQNGCNAEAALLPDDAFDYLNATQFFIPMTALEARNYEVSLQAIDMWNATSGFTTPLIVNVERSLINAPDTVCVGTDVDVTYAGVESAERPVWNFNGATVVSGSGFGPYVVRWSTDGTKVISLTLGNIVSSDTLFVDRVDHNVQLPTVLLQNQSVTVDIPEGLEPTWRAQIDGNWHVVGPGGINDSYGKYSKIKAVDNTLIIEDMPEMTFGLMLTLRNGHGCESSVMEYVRIIGSESAPVITLVTVDENAHNVINFEVNATYIPQVRILKETNVLNEFDEVAVIASSRGSYIDTGSDATKTSDRYKVQGVLSNGSYTQASTIHKTVHATISKGVVDGTYNLIWNAYEGADVVTYNIYRGASKTSLSQIASVAASATSYTDNAPVDEQPFYAVEYVLSSAASAPSRRVQAASALTGRSNIVEREQLQGLEDIDASSAPRKILIDNVIYILRGDHIYTLTGTEVK